MKSRWMHELFSFSRKERNGIVILLLIIFLIILIGRLIPLIVHPDQPDFSKWEVEVKNYLAKNKSEQPVNGELHAVAFDPNKVDSLSLVNMGLPSKLVINWIHYLRKGGIFRDKEGVKRLYGMTSGIFEQLESFIVIPAKPAFPGSEVRNGKNKYRNNTYSDTIPEHILARRAIQERVSFELNSADSLQLVSIPGIGPVLSSRIIRYRDLLGGYYSVSQLKEIYGMREENFMAVSPYFTIDRSWVRTFNINFSTIRELGRHPYIGFRTAGKIFKLRDKTGKFSSADELSTVMTKDSLIRLLPYLKFSQ